MISALLSSFIHCFACIILCCLLVQVNGEVSKKLPEYSLDTKDAKRLPSTHHEEASTGKHLDNRDVSNTTHKSVGNTTTAAPSPSLNYGLRILISCSLSVSTTCHSLVLITYGLFRQLRNVPGLNVMNMCLSLALSQLAYLIAISHFNGTIVCDVLAIFIHYLRLSSFLSVSIISYHTLFIFSRPFVGRISNGLRSEFIKYSIVVWLSPAVFVVICFTLDKTQVFPLDYGTNCWIGSKNGRLFWYIIPSTALMFYNVYKFIQTALSLSRHYKQTHETIRCKKGKQNLLVCVKLAALVTCPCFLPFFAVLFPDVEALNYLYAVFACLQGVYIGQMFLLNKRTIKLYKNWWRKHRNVGADRLQHVARPTRNVVPLANTAFRLS